MTQDLTGDEGFKPDPNNFLSPYADRQPFVILLFYIALGMLVYYIITKL
jgi:hypothetical protein